MYRITSTPLRTPPWNLSKNQPLWWTNRRLLKKRKKILRTRMSLLSLLSPLRQSIMSRWSSKFLTKTIFKPRAWSECKRDRIILGWRRHRSSSLPRKNYCNNTKIAALSTRMTLSRQTKMTLTTWILHHQKVGSVFRHLRSKKNLKLPEAAFGGWTQWANKPRWGESPRIGGTSTLMTKK